MKIAILGGSFDPIHFGHLWTAQHAAEQLELDEVIFLPAATSPLKPGGARASAEQRWQMVRLAIQLAEAIPLGPAAPADGPSADKQLGGRQLGDGQSPAVASPGAARHCRLTIDDRELRRGGVSYTIDTVEQLQRERVASQWYLMIGSDAFAAIDRWHRAAELLQRITPLVYCRGAEQSIAWECLDGLVSPQRAAEIRAAAVQMPRIELSSSELRRRVAAGQNIRFQLPAAVADYIGDQRLYQAVAPPS